MARADLSGSDAFYFDASHDQRSQPVHAAEPQGRLWARALVGLCLGAQRHRRNSSPCAGSSSRLEPPDYANKLYVQRGDGRLAGVTLQWRW